MISVKVENIVKSYGKTEALRGVDFSVERGEVFGIIGADGAGKTTLFRILTTLLLADKGCATIEGFDVVKNYSKIREISGYMPGRFSLYQDMTVEENLTFYATLFGTTIKENYYLIEDIYKQIEPFKDRKAGKLSGGMKQKLALSCALIHKPSVLFLDEPTTGVDPVSRKEFWGMLKKLRGEEITILVSTPYMDEALQCDRIGLINNGTFLKTDTPRAIIESFGEQIWAVASADMARLLADLRAYADISSCFAFGEFHHITFRREISKASLMEYLAAKGHTNVNIKTIEPTIEDCFMKLSV